MTTVRDSTSASGTGNSLTLTIPASTQTGDTLVLFAASRYTPATSLAGWALLDEGESTSSYAQYSVFTRRAAGTAGATSDDAGDDVSVTMSGSYDCFAALIVVEGTPRFLGLVESSVQDSNTCTTTYSSTNSADLVLHFGWFRANQATTTLSCDPGTEIEQATTTNAGGMAASSTGNQGVGATCTFTGSTAGTGQDGMVAVTAAFSANQPSNWLRAVLGDNPTVAYELGETFGTNVMDYMHSSHMMSSAGLLALGQNPTAGGDLCPRLDGTAKLILGRADLTIGQAAVSAEMPVIPEVTRTDVTALLQVGSTTNWRFRLGLTGYRQGQVYSSTRNVGLITSSDVQFSRVSVIAETLDGTTKKLYLNGTEAASAATTGTVATGRVNIFYTSTVGQEMIGRVAGLALWVGATLTADQVAAHAGSASIMLSDDFADAVDICADIGGTVTADSTGWTTEASEPGSMSHTGWATITPDIAGTYTLSTVGSDFDTLLAVYTGDSIDDLTLIDSDDDSGGSGTSLLTLDLAAGTTYRVQVGAQPAGAGGSLKVTCTRNDFGGHVYKGRLTKTEDTVEVA